MATNQNDSHNMIIGYVFWIFGLPVLIVFTMRAISGTIYFFTGGIFLIGWIIDLFLIPSMEENADRKFQDGNVDYSIAWGLLTFLGVLGIHRIYMGKILTGILYSSPVDYFSSDTSTIFGLSTSKSTK